MCVINPFSPPPRFPFSWGSSYDESCLNRGTGEKVGYLEDVCGVAIYPARQYTALLDHVMGIMGIHSTAQSPGMVDRLP